VTKWIVWSWIRVLRWRLMEDRPYCHTGGYALEIGDDQFFLCFTSRPVQSVGSMCASRRKQPGADGNRHAFHRQGHPQ
jgi:hypothetical protein